METKTGTLSIAVSSLFMFSFVALVKGSLSFNFYAAACPSQESIIRNIVSSSSSTDTTIPGKVLRLVFHDCFVVVSVQLFQQMCFSSYSNCFSFELLDSTRSNEESKKKNENSFKSTHSNTLVTLSSRIARVKCVDAIRF